MDQWTCPSRAIHLPVCPQCQRLVHERPLDFCVRFGHYWCRWFGEAIVEWYCIGWTGVCHCTACRPELYSMVFMPHFRPVPICYLHEPVSFWCVVVSLCSSGSWNCFTVESRPKNVVTKELAWDFLRLRLHDNAGGENATKSFRIHGSFTRYAEQNVKVVHQNGRKPKRWPRWKNLKTEMFCRIN